MGLTLLGRDAETGRAARGRRRHNSSDGSWYSTQSVAFALVAVAQNTGTKPFTGFSFDYATGNARKQTVKGDAPVAHVKLPPPPVSGTPLTLTNTSDRKLYVTGQCAATPRSGEEDASANGLTLDRRIQRCGRQAGRRAQGAAGHRSHRAGHGARTSASAQLDNLALSQLVPAGWEIRNDRLEGVDTQGERSTEKQPLGHVLVGAGRLAQPGDAQRRIRRHPRRPRAALLQPARRASRSSSRRGSMRPISAGSIYRAPASRPCTTPISTRGSRANGSKWSRRSAEKLVQRRRATQHAAACSRRWRGACVGWRACVLAAAARARCSTTPESYVLEARDGTLLSRAHRQRWPVALSAARARCRRSSAARCSCSRTSASKSTRGVDGLAIARAVQAQRSAPAAS